LNANNPTPFEAGSSKGEERRGLLDLRHGNGRHQMPPSVCVLPAHSSKQVHIAGIGISDKHNADYCAQSSEIKCLETRPPQGIRRQTHEPIRAARTDCGCYVGAGFWPTSGNVTSGGAMLSGLDVMMVVEEKPACRTANAKTAVGARSLGSSRGQSPGEHIERYSQPGTKKAQGVGEYV